MTILNRVDGAPSNPGAVAETNRMVWAGGWMSGGCICKLIWNRASSAGGTGNVENFCKAKTYRDPFGRDDRRGVDVRSRDGTRRRDVTEEQIV